MNANDLLKSHGLRVTAQRNSIVTVFQEFGHAISYKDIVSKLPKEFDRVTVYRTLKSFEDKGLLHLIPDPSGEPKYALCHHDDHHHDHTHDDSHAHFKCTECGKILCLTSKHEPDIKVPAGYHVEKVIALATGTCDQCTVS